MIAPREGQTCLAWRVTNLAIANLHYHRTIKIALAICESGLAGCEILFGGVGWIATYIRLTPLDDLTATLIEVSIARDIN